MTISTKILGGLLHLTDPTLPIGGFNHSGGLETDVQQRSVHNASTLEQWLHTQLTQNWAYNDGAYLQCAYHDAQRKDLNALLILDAQICASKAARESREAAEKLGKRLLKIFARYHHAPLLSGYQQAIEQGKARGYYPIAYAMIAVLEQMRLPETLYSFYTNMTVGAVTNGVKLIPLSQMDGQDILYRSRAVIAVQVQQQLTHPEHFKQKLGATAAASDIRAMQHERLYSRLYMS